MKLHSLAAFAIVCITLSAVPAPGQVAAAAAAGVTTAAPHLVAATPALLTGAISSGSTHVGQTVLAKLASPSSLSNGFKLPAGSELVGKVTQAQPLSSSSNGTSKLGMLFDHVRTPKGEEQAISPASLRSIGSGSARANAQEQNGSSSAQPPQRQQPSTANPVGGLLGGVTDAVGSTVNAATTTTGLLLGTVTGLPGILLDSTGNLAAKGRDVNIPANTHISVQASSEAQTQQ